MIVYIIVTLLTVGMAAMVKTKNYGAAGIEILLKKIKAAGSFGTQGSPLGNGDYDQVWPDDGALNRRRLYNALWLTAIFAVLFGLSALRYRVGNDYTRYEEFFHLIPLKQVVPTEFGFNISVLLIQWIFGGEAALPIFTVYALVTVFFMLKGVWEQSRDFLFSFFLFMTLSFYFQSLNTVRYYLAWAVAVYSMKYVLRKEYAKFILIILITATIHKSILLVIPVYLLAAAPLKKWHMGLITMAAVSGLILKPLYLKIIIKLYSSYEGTSYLAGGTSVINIIRITAVLVLSLLLYKKSVKGDRQMEFCARLNYFAFLLYTCGSFVPEISRIGYYMSAGHIFLIPALIQGIENKTYRQAMYVFTVIAAVIYFGAFLVSAKEPLVRIVPYHTWVLPGGIE